MVSFFVALSLLPPSFARSIPAFRAYSEPNPNGIQIGEAGPATGWKDPKQHLVWFAKFRKAGSVQVRLKTTESMGRVPEGVKLTLITAGEKTIPTQNQIVLSASARAFPLGSVEVNPGTIRFDLSSDKPLPNVGIESLELEGEPVADALINETRWRSSASVHLRWPTEKDAPVAWFYNEIVPKSSPLATYYMACGWSRGYFGIQVNSPSERRVIFSVWDSGSEKVSRDKVADELKVKLVAKGDGVYSGDFGNEGTGGHSHLVYPWVTGEVQRFLVHAEPSGTHTIYSGYYYFNDKKKWGLISSWSAPQDGGYLRSLYSFIEDFWGGEGQKLRMADFGPAWVRIGETWSQITNGSFTHTARVPNYREDYFFRLNASRVTAATGGYSDEGPVPYGKKFEGIKAAKPLNASVLNFIKSIEKK